MKSYCENCKSLQPSSFRLGHDAVTSEPYEDLCCNTCHFIVATVQGRQALAQPAQEPVREALKLALEALENHIGNYKLDDAGCDRQEAAITAINEALAQPAQDESDLLTIAYQSGYYDGKKAALAAREWNFCERCGKRTKDSTTIHTCTPPQGDT